MTFNCYTINYECHFIQNSSKKLDYIYCSSNIKNYLCGKLTTINLIAVKLHL